MAVSLGPDHPSGGPLAASHVVDFDLCWAIDLVDPWRNQYELNCYDYDRVRVDLVEPAGLTPLRYWPSDFHDRYLAGDER